MFLSTRDTYLAIYTLVINMSPDFMWEFFGSNLLQYNLQKAKIYFVYHLPDPPDMELIPCLSVEVYSGIALPVI